MPPGEKVSRDELINAAVSIVENEGLPGLTARRVAAMCDVSTAPVYRNFDSMEDLGRSVMERCREILLDYTSGSYTERPFLNMGVGIALFARDHPRLYQTLFLQSDQFGPLVEGFLEQLTENMKRDSRFQAMNRDDRARLLETMWTYTHGMASLIAVGLARDTSVEGIVASLSSVGGAVIGAMRPEPDPTVAPS